MSPMPERIDRPDGLFYIRARWKLCRVMWPQRCAISGRRLWPGTLAYRGQAKFKNYVTMPWGSPVMEITEIKWHHAAEHIIWQLKE